MTTSNGLPYEEYKGFYLTPGITMQAQGVFEWNVYKSVEDVVMDKPLAVFSDKYEALGWVDNYEEKHGERARITPEIDRLRDELYSGLSAAHIDEVEAGPMYDKLVGIAETLGYWPQADALKGIAADERRHRDMVYQMMEKIPPPYVSLGG